MKRVNLDEWADLRDDLLLARKSIGFVPTMGALHDGHLSLLRKAKSENDIVLLSIFVNPTQFNNLDDLVNYPSTIEKDIELAGQNGCDFVITPSKDVIYPDDYRYRVSESDFSTRLDGAHRPGHFDGVLTVVLKLFNIAKATRAYFGKKDYQQFELIREMAEAFFLDIEVIGCETVREADGLAMSSRNVRLSSSERQRARNFPRRIAESLLKDETAAVVRAKLETDGFEVDYVEDVLVGTPKESRRFGAVHVGKVRLIDNLDLITAKSILGESR